MTTDHTRGLAAEGTVMREIAMARALRRDGMFVVDGVFVSYARPRRAAIAKAGGAA